MCCSNLSKKDPFITSQGIESHSAIVSHDNQVTVVVGEHKLLDLLLHLNLVRKDESLSIVDVNAISVISHYGKTAYCLTTHLREISSANIRHEIFA